ncbi:hypothetical protein OPV22_017200 [Ensete ventricosum]|uniref:Methyltransferase n=1 Tax=Ensete ventricosum TaxID=4639 RepID=A0AAV8QT98_ENSVE|nr:hypothetical protein OPV22_017200 [Ensete ventricosum]
MDNEEAIKTERGRGLERHCLLAAKRIDCLVPAPKEYQKPIPWPQSRVKSVWFSNGGESQLIHGADQYLDQIPWMIPDIAFGNHTSCPRCCDIASFGAVLLSRNVLQHSGCHIQQARHLT